MKHYKEWEYDDLQLIDIGRKYQTRMCDRWAKALKLHPLPRQLELREPPLEELPPVGRLALPLAQSRRALASRTVRPRL